MAFEEGHKSKGKRPKGGKNKQRLIKYSPKKWLKISSHNTHNQDEITHRLENNLPIDDLIDIMNEKYSRNKVHGNTKKM